MILAVCIMYLAKLYSFSTSPFRMQMLKAVPTFLLRYSMDMSPKEFVIFSKMRHLLNSWGILKVMALMLLASVPISCMNLITSYITYSQNWRNVIVVATLNTVLIDPLIENWMWWYAAKARRMIYSRIISTYYIVSHSNDSIPMPDYISVIQSCLFPALYLPSKMLPKLSILWRSTFTTCYLVYLLDINT